MRIYDRFISSEEFGPGRVSPLGAGSEPTLFRFKSGPTEAAAHGGPLTLKAVAAGSVAYRFGPYCYATSPEQVLVAPSSARYSTHVGEAGASILTLYFPAALALDALSCLTQSDERLLEGHVARSDPILGFPAHKRAADRRLQGALDALAVGRSTRPLESQALDALQSTVLFALEASGATARIAATSSVVRKELFRRACVARDSIEQSLNRPSSLKELARTACLSPFHLHRVFKAAFGETPAQMCRRRRIETAQKMLGMPRLPVCKIAAAVGFDNESAFSRSFRNVTGHSPTAYRRSVTG